MVGYHGGSSGQSLRNFCCTLFITSWDTPDRTVRLDIYHLRTFTILGCNASIDHTQRRRVGEVAVSPVNDAKNYNMGYMLNVFLKFY
jgi:hypothetical protein